MHTVGNLKVGQYLFSIPRCASSPFSWTWTTILDLSTISLFSTSCQNLQLVLCFHDEFPRLLLSLPTSTSPVRHLSFQAFLHSFLLFLPWVGLQVYLCAWISLKYHCHSAIPLLCGCVSSESCPTLCDPKDCNPPGSYVYGILQVRILEWVAILLSRESSWPWDWTWVSCIADSLLSEPTPLLIRSHATLSLAGLSPNSAAWHSKCFFSRHCFAPTSFPQLINANTLQSKQHSYDRQPVSVFLYPLHFLFCWKFPYFPPWAKSPTPSRTPASS